VRDNSKLGGDCCAGENPAAHARNKIEQINNLKHRIAGPAILEIASLAVFSSFHRPPQLAKIGFTEYKK